LRANAYAKAEVEMKAKDKAKAKENILKEDDKLTFSEPVMAAPASVPPPTEDEIKLRTNQKCKRDHGCQYL
jgi:hypothetical protein